MQKYTSRATVTHDVPVSKFNSRSYHFLICVSLQYAWKAAKNSGTHLSRFLCPQCVVPVQCDLQRFSLSSFLFSMDSSVSNASWSFFIHPGPWGEGSPFHCLEKDWFLHVPFSVCDPWVLLRLRRNILEVFSFFKDLDCHLLMPSGRFSSFQVHLDQCLWRSAAGCPLFRKKIHLLLAIRCSSKALPCVTISSVACPGTCSTSSHPVGRDLIFSPISVQTSECSLLLGVSFSAVALRISFLPFSTHSQSVCMRVGMSNARMAHVAASSSPLTDVWPVRALIERCMFSLLSFEKKTPASALAIASHLGSRHDPSVYNCNLPSQRYPPSSSAALAALILLPSSLSRASPTLLLNFSAAATAAISLVLLILSQSKSWCPF